MQGGGSEGIERMTKQTKIIKPKDFRKHPFWFRSMNYIWEKSYQLSGRPVLDKDELITAARNETGLSELGKDFWDEPLERLIQSLNQEAGLHPIGYYISRKRIINLLSVRLRAEQLFRKHPGILDQEILPTIIIIGLQRTGTTKLHRLLTADPENRVLRSWEAINPVPFHSGLRKKDRRVRSARTSEKALRLIAPGFFAIHPVEFTAPEEDILLLDVTFLSTTPEATAHVPSYAAWLETIDQSYAYDYGGKLLKLLQWQHPGKRWILKSPHHMEFLPLIEKHFNRPKFLWTHRHINECIPSFLSMVSYSRSIFSDQVSMEGVADHWVRKTSYMLQKGLSFRNLPGKSELFTDIAYQDLVSQPLDQIERIYQLFGGMPESLKQCFQRAEADNPYGKYGIHEYSLEDFNLGPMELTRRNSAYLQLMDRVIQPGVNGTTSHASDL
jgi:hypothetical protein